MKLYSIYDVLLQAHLQMFLAANDGQVKANLADQVNDTEGRHAITKAPHHFQLYALAEISDEGEVTPNKQLLCDLSSLIRGGIRESGTARAANGAGSAQSHGGGPGGAPPTTGTPGSPAAHAPLTAHQQAP